MKVSSNLWSLRSEESIGLNWRTDVEKENITTIGNRMCEGPVVGQTEQNEWSTETAIETRQVDSPGHCKILLALGGILFPTFVMKRWVTPSHCVLKCSDCWVKGAEAREVRKRKRTVGREIRSEA